MTNNVYLDLEGTIIDNFYGGNLINVEKIRQVLIQAKVHTIGIFSFAIGGHTNQDDFFERIAPKIKKALNVAINDVPTIPDMMRMDTYITGVRFNPLDGIEMTDWLSIRGKEDAFRLWVRGKEHHNQTFTLIDDVVPNLTIFYGDIGTNIQYVNVDSIKIKEPLK